MSTTLKVDIDEMESLVSSLWRVEGYLDRSDYWSDRVADAVGHDALAQRCRDFSRSWDDNRVKVVERVAGIRTSVSKIAASFAELETELATAITGGSDNPIPVVRMTPSTSQPSGNSGGGGGGGGGR
ncbi:MAG: hypothetical protein RIC81_09265 [Microcella pacifica]|uniref:hypothetical protein n=1 Tax=Microcella pacifica TaxID=2591847 RepID=UPI00331490BE